MEKPTIPSREYSLRQQRLQQEMQKSGLDAVICYSDDGAVFGQEYTRWLFNYQPHFEPALTVVPASGESWILTGIESEEYVYESSECKNVKVVDAFVYESHEFPFSTSYSLGSQISEILGSTTLSELKVGIAGLNRIPHPTFTQLQKVFEVGTFESAEEIFTSLRLVKSEAETQVIRYAYYIAQKGIETAISAIEVGKPERAIAAEAEYVMRSLGSEGMGIDTMVASGARLTRPIIARTTQKQVENNELVTLTFAPRYEGYHAAIARPVTVGNVDGTIITAVETAMAAQEAGQELLRPGTSGHQIDATARKVVADAGYGENFVYTGAHSIGVAEFEPPSLSSSYREPLAENMIFSIDIPMFLASWGGMRYESGYIVGAEGGEALQSLSHEIIRR